MATQITSSKRHWACGGTNLNCNFSIGIDIIMPIVRALLEISAIDENEYKWFEKNNNSKQALPRLDVHIFSCKHDTYVQNKRTLIEKEIKTRQGTLVGIACGVSKTALIFEVNKEGHASEKFVFKYGKYVERKKDEKTFIFKADDRAMNNVADQIQAQYQKYVEAIRSNNQELLNVLLPCFKVFERYNAIIEPFVDNIDTIENVCDITRQNVGEILAILRHNDIYDVSRHPGNSGIYQGRAVVIDYGL